MDVVAAKLGHRPAGAPPPQRDPGDDDLPYTMPTGMVYDQITAALNLDQAVEMVDYEQLPQAAGGARAEGRLLGIGVSLFAEPTAMAFGCMSTDAATVRIGSNGKVDVVTSTANHGQSLETTMAQVVADELGVDVDDVRVHPGRHRHHPGRSGHRRQPQRGDPGPRRRRPREDAARTASPIVAQLLEAVARRPRVRSTAASRSPGRPTRA